MSEYKKAVAESKLSLSEEMHLGFLQSIAKTNTEKITVISQKMLPKVDLRCVDVGKGLWAVGC
jgi:hypothetical protein